MTEQKEQATSKKQGQKQIPFGDDRQERQRQSKKDNGKAKKTPAKKMRTFSSKLEISDFRLRLRLRF
jgi:hypothetical protein